MDKFPVILDLETQYTFREFNDHKKLRVSVAVIYDYRDQQGKVFEEKEISKLFPILESASYIIGYNSRSFDMPVLSAYYPGDIAVFNQFDILEDIREKIGRRLALNDVIHATLGLKKSGHGLMAIDYFREGKMDELKSYCLDDVMVTKKLFDHGVASGEINYIDEVGKQTIKVDWKKYIEEKGEKKDMPLTLPF